MLLKHSITNTILRIPFDVGIALGLGKVSVLDPRERHILGKNKTKKPFGMREKVSDTLAPWLGLFGFLGGRRAGGERHGTNTAHGSPERGRPSYGSTPQPECRSGGSWPGMSMGGQGQPWAQSRSAGQCLGPRGQRRYLSGAKPPSPRGMGWGVRGLWGRARQSEFCSLWSIGGLCLCGGL